MNPLANAGVFLTQVAFETYIFILIFRVLLQWYHFRSYNPVTHFIAKITNPVIKPFNRFVPRSYRLDIPAFVLLILLDMIKLALLLFLQQSETPNILGLAIWGLGDVLANFINVLFYLILIGVVISWVAPMSRNPVVVMVQSVTEAILRPARRILPPIGMIDLSPIIALVVLQLINILLVQPTMAFGFGLSLSGLS